MQPQAQLVMDRAAAIRHACKAQGISEEAIAIAIAYAKYKHGEGKGTNQGHNAAWIVWATWCLATSRNPLALRVGDVSDYVAHLVSLKRSEALVRKHLAMLSVTHRLLFCHTASYTPLNDAPIIDSEMMRKGVHNMLAPAPVVEPGSVVPSAAQAGGRSMEMPAH